VFFAGDFSERTRNENNFKYSVDAFRKPANFNIPRLMRDAQSEVQIAKSKRCSKQPETKQGAAGQ
jgi:hypothetical protein